MLRKMWPLCVEIQRRLFGMEGKMKGILLDILRELRHIRLHLETITGKKIDLSGRRR